MAAAVDVERQPDLQPDLRRQKPARAAAVSAQPC
jgi:hypothetical protein